MQYVIRKNDFITNKIVADVSQKEELERALSATLLDVTLFNLEIGDFWNGLYWTRNVNGEQVRLTVLGEPTTLDEYRAAALVRIDGKCSAAIYSGVTVGEKHYKLTPTAQGNLATAQAKVDGGAENVIYAADNEEPTLHTAEQITAISDAAYKWGIVNTSYYAKLQKWIACETDKDALAVIDYGSTLPDDLMHELGTLLAGAGINIADYVGLIG